jgi:LysR family hydrogen peroxide-inducible transcriptional activator
VMIALPIDHPEIETRSLFEDSFLLATPIDDPLPELARVTPHDVDTRRLILLEDGHCLRDQALGICSTLQGEAIKKLGATSLTTVLQMVASGYGVTLVPEIAVSVERRDERVKLIRFAEPEPRRTIGLAWHRTSSRQADFVALGRLVTEIIERDAATASITPAQRRQEGWGNAVFRAPRVAKSGTTSHVQWMVHDDCGSVASFRA